MSFGGGGNSSGSQVIERNPYEPAQPALNQIISEASNLYNQGVGAAGFVAPSTQTTEGLASQELLARTSQQQIADTLSGRFLNPFLSPLLQQSASTIADSVNQQFSGAGRTPGSPMSQQEILSGITAEALPLAFDSYERERGRQLGLAQSQPTLTQVGSALENIERQRNLAPFAALQQFSGLVNPIATGLPTQMQNTNVNPNRFTQAAGGALVGSQLGTLGGAAFGVQGAVLGALLGGLL
jgi:hypothetical protein